MRNRNRITPTAESGPTEVASTEKRRAAAYAAMGKYDVVEPRRSTIDHLPVAPNGRPYDPRSGRYVDR
jgi:hypothetical protein